MPLSYDSLFPIYILYEQRDVSIFSDGAILTSKFTLISNYFHGSNKESIRAHFVKDKLIEELMSIEGNSSKLPKLKTQFDDFPRRSEILYSELAVSKKLMPSKRKNYHSRKILGAQYHHQLIELNPVPISISNGEMEENISKAPSLSG